MFTLAAVPLLSRGQTCCAAKPAVRPKPLKRRLPQPFRRTSRPQAPRSSNQTAKKQKSRSSVPNAVTRAPRSKSTRPRPAIPIRKTGPALSADTNRRLRSKSLWP